MSDKNTDFCFVPEEKNAFSSNRESKEKFSFFLKGVCSFILCGGVSIWLLSPPVSKNLNPSRTIQSTPSVSADEQKKELALDSFFVLLKSDKGSQLTKVEVTLQLSDPQVLEEVKQSTATIKDHLVFILSHQNVSVFSHLEERQSLEEEITHQINLFLVSGEIENVQLKETFLNRSEVLDK